MKKMKTESGKVKSNNPLVNFLYLLARDKLPLGEIEELLESVAEETTVYTNGWLANWAKYSAGQILHTKIEEVECNHEK